MTRLEIENERPGIPAPGGESGGGEPGAGERQNDRKIEQTIAFMMRHLDRPLQVAEMAAEAGISPSHYSALFKRRVGCPPINFFIRLRMHHACQLLDSTSLNIKEVAAALGYQDPFYFSRVFKSVNRLAPSEYRILTAQRRETGREDGSGRWRKEGVSEAVAA